jgi:ABC-type molybdate transport system substrate-binding protein
MDARTLKVLEHGGKVLLTIKKGSVKPEKGGSIAVGFSSIFWNTAWTGGQPPHTLGILCNPKHKALANFPTEFHSNWQWWDAMSHSNALILSDFPADLRPIVRIIDDWFTNRPLALIFEAKIGKGKIIVCGVDLLTNAENRPEARQLLYSLKSYMTGTSFIPTTEIETEKLRAMFIQ